jgi:hypothetical protein
MKIHLIALLVLFAPSAFAQSALPSGMPICRTNKGVAITAFDNTKVMNLKVTTANLYKEQVLVKATLVSIGAVTNNSFGRHMHFIVTLAGPTEQVAHTNIIEIAHSMNTYTSPTAADLTGPIYICGEYSTTDATKLPKITKFTPSPTGAMIHWTHLANPNINSIPSHPHGWIFANGKLFGTYSSIR